ncbi:hypothetical protein KQI88_10395 [Alkaliphilus sp. MSJ-5]|uniref:Uncharacterized protein n=1 Tax=Alkaliphilus flagellatus TaxID=2841507 RepID=A0ABS6G5D5_9FIRM|nr:hypothetical protein [Alkaliphilus flagellatus]MBU5676828.1 hypothetical protein [Alkaliphilus flagellatus]
MEKANKKLGIVSIIKRIMLYVDNKYDRLQKEEIILGLDKGLDTYFYKNRNFDWKQMREIRLGLEKGLDVSVYAKEEFNVEQMEEIRLGQEKNLDVSFYSKPEFDWRQMREIKLGLDRGLDVSTFTKPDLNIEQMEEVRLGLEKGIDVSFYNKSEFDWKQMREIRIGLERGLDVSTYAKDNLSVEQMEKMRVKQEKQNPIVNQLNVNKRDESKKELENKQASRAEEKSKSKSNEEPRLEKKSKSKQESKSDQEDVDEKKRGDIENKNEEEDFSFSRYDANVILPIVKRSPSKEQIEKLLKQRYKNEKEAVKQSNIFQGRIRKLINRGYMEERNGKYSITVKGAKAAKEIDKKFEFTPYDANVVFGHIEAANGLLTLGNLYSQLEEEYSKPEDVEKQFVYLKNRLENNFKCGYVLKNDKGAYSISEIGEMKAEEVTERAEEFAASIDESIEELEF